MAVSMAANERIARKSQAPSNPPQSFNLGVRSKNSTRLEALPILGV